MTETKIRRSIFILIGLTVLTLVGMVLGWFFVLVRPQKEQIADVQSKYETRKTIAGKLTSNLEAKQKAEDRQRYVNAQLAFFRGSAETKWLGRYRSFRFEDIGTDPSKLTPVQRANRNDAFGRLLREYFSSYGESLQTSLVRRADTVGPIAALGETAKLRISFPQPQVEAPPKAPEDVVVPPNALIKPTGATGGGVLAVSISGTFRQVKEFLRTINYEPILFVVGNVKLAGGGTSRVVTADFTLTPYMLATGNGAEKIEIAGAGGEKSEDNSETGTGPRTAPGATPTPAPTT